MRILLIGLGQIGLGLIVPVFQKAGYEIIGTDANVERLSQLRNGYILETPNETSKLMINVKEMSEIAGEFDLVITSVGRQHLGKVADWLKDKNISAPVLLAENLPDPVNIFSRQIPNVVDRICPRVEKQNGTLVAVAEDYFKIVVLDDPLTHRLSLIKGVEIEKTEEDVEAKRKKKMFTVNISHVLASLYGQRLGCLLVEEAVQKPEISSKIQSAIAEIGPWLGLDGNQVSAKAEEIIKRFSLHQFQSAGFYRQIRMQFFTFYYL